MISFILSAVVLIVVALLFIVPTLLKKNQPFSEAYDELNVSIAKDRLNEIKQQRDAGDISEEQYQQLQAELESTLALDLEAPVQTGEQQAEQTVADKNKLSPILLALLIPLSSAGIYSQLGDFNAATGVSVESVSIPEGEDRPQMTIEEAVVKLEQKLATDSGNPDGWFMLAKTYMVTKQYHKAKDAYEKTIQLVGEDPELLLRYVDAIAMTEGGNLNGSAKPVLNKVIELLPDSATVLWMAGTSENQAGNYPKALSYWYKLRPMLTSDAESLAQIEQLISQAESHLTENEIASLKSVAPQAEEQAPTTQATAAEIVVSVALDPSLRDRVSASDTLFIFAKALQGPPMPLAAVKQTVAALPLTVSLNDAMAMMPQMKLSSFEQVKVSAVISKSGQPGVKPGDLFVEVSPVQVNSMAKINLIINQVK